MYQPFGAIPATNNSIFGFLSKIKWSKIFSGTQKTINFINQAVPLYYNVKPIFKNLKTLNSIGKSITSSAPTKQVNNIGVDKIVNNPSYFI